ncbi:MAG: RNA polymerase sigma-70 factor [Sphingobacteriales bacterium]|nr:MAG: RNA polymerase sigma-70 factor [Sphingobacteriales bacterium]
MANEPGGTYTLSADSTIVFEQTFKSHFKALHAYACTILKDEATAEEMVQNVFYKLWEKKEQVTVQQSLSAYLYRSVYYECLNYIKHTKVKSAYQSHATYHTSELQQASDSASLRQLQEKIDEALRDLPEQCRTIFQMSRFEELKYREIANRLGLSVKTVENQMGKALRILREKLADFLPALIFLLLNL